MKYYQLSIYIIAANGEGFYSFSTFKTELGLFSCAEYRNNLLKKTNEYSNVTPVFWQEVTEAEYEILQNQKCN
jgi:hypothetical protein